MEPKENVSFGAAAVVDVDVVVVVKPEAPEAVIADFPKLKIGVVPVADVVVVANDDGAALKLSNKEKYSTVQLKTT